LLDALDEDEAEDFFAAYSALTGKAYQSAPTAKRCIRSDACSSSPKNEGTGKS